MAGKLTDKQVRAVTPKEKNLKLFDGDGMFLEVTPKGGKWWRLKYRIAGKEKLISLGTYPKVSLAEARTKCQEARKLIANGFDPSQVRKEAKAQAKLEGEHKCSSFEEVALEWHERMTTERAPKYRKQLLAQLKNNLFPFIGGVPITDLQRTDIVKCLRRIEENGHIDLAHRVAVVAGQVWEYAMNCGFIDYDITSKLGGALAKAKHTSRAALTDPKEIGAMLRDIDACDGTTSTRYALKILPYVFTRSTELLGACWEEIDLDKALWTIPAARMKRRREHLVPLARQVVDLLNELREFCDGSKFVFPSNSKEGHLTGDGLLKAFRYLGYGKRKMDIHGFRSIASTSLNEMGFRPDVIEMQLAHAQKDSTRAAYNRALYLEERTEMMQHYADYLDRLRDAKE